MTSVSLLAVSEVVQRTVTVSELSGRTCLLQYLLVFAN